MGEAGYCVGDTIEGRPPQGVNPAEDLDCFGDRTDWGDKGDPDSLAWNDYITPCKLMMFDTPAIVTEKTEAAGKDRGTRSVAGLWFFTGVIIDTCNGGVVKNEKNWMYMYEGPIPHTDEAVGMPWITGPPRGPVREPQEPIPRNWDAFKCENEPE